MDVSWSLIVTSFGDLGKSKRPFWDELDFCSRSYRLELAWTCCGYANTLPERNP